MKRKMITIEVTEEEVDALEDIFFCKLSEEQRHELNEHKLSLWKKVVDAFDPEDEAEGFVADAQAEAEENYKRQMAEDQDELQRLQNGNPPEAEGDE